VLNFKNSALGYDVKETVKIVANAETLVIVDTEAGTIKVQ
jgi:hypothetical protein